MLSSRKSGSGLRTGIAAFAAMTLLSGGTVAKADEFLTIGTGGVTGIYYAVRRGDLPAGQSRAQRARHPVALSKVPAARSTICALCGRENWRWASSSQIGNSHALHGTSLFEENEPDEELRSLFSLHPDTVIIAARQDTGIKSLDDLGGKTIKSGKSRVRHPWHRRSAS